MVKKHRKNDTGRVYSTEFGKICPKCDKPAKQCACRKQQDVQKNDGIVRLMRQTKGRKGKGVTLITGVPIEDNKLKKLAKSLKQKCGTGGAVKNGMIEIQGDQRDELEKQLRTLGYTVKRAGA
ncbi:MAG: translation initiation factor Sui1 [Candidatus Electrothrix sp. AR4]|nr:translation initiation factor Sui1 [Candidatus Electrothrix sp. AR4]